MPALYTASLLRGINVGANNLIGMPALTEVYQRLGLTDVRTLLRSGNVVFRGKAAARRIEDAIDREFGFRPRVFLRSLAELREVLAANPFPEVAASDPQRLHVLFCDSKPEVPRHGGPERMKAVGRELFIHYVDGAGRSKLRIQTVGTARNWNTVGKLVELMEAP